ncbi:alpha/beta hydrolase [Actinopolymorpha singaporensis]
MSHVHVYPDAPGPARPSRRAVTVSAVLGAFLVASGADVAAARTASADILLRLPAPTGPHPVGLTTWYLVDRSRRDPWDGTIPVRELVATVFYPARGVRRHPPAPQLAPVAAAVFGALAPYQHPGLPVAGVDWAATMTHAHQDAPAAPARRPVLLHSPGGGDPRGFGAGLAQDLASHGFVVVTVDHPGDALVVEFPGTTEYRGDVVRTTAFREDPRSNPATFDTMISTRIADLRFVLDQVEVLAGGGNPDATGRVLPTGLARAVDPRRVGVYGHSAGGTAVAQATYDDRRMDAAIDLEGYLDHPGERPGEPGRLFPVAEYGVNRPLLLWGTDGFPDRAGMERSWQPMLAHPGGWTRRRELRDAAHWAFTDFAAFAPQLQAAGLMTADARTALVGAIEPTRSVPTVRTGVREFFACHLGT